MTIWNLALTQQEIQSFMTTPPAGSESGLVGYWNFNEGTGTTLRDQTANGNNGTIYGATWGGGQPAPLLIIPVAQPVRSHSIIQLQQGIAAVT